MRCMRKLRLPKITADKQLMLTLDTCLVNRLLAESPVLFAILHGNTEESITAAFLKLNACTMSHH